MTVSLCGSLATTGESSFLHAFIGKPAFVQWSDVHFTSSRRPMTQVCHTGEFYMAIFRNSYGRQEIPSEFDAFTQTEFGIRYGISARRIFSPVL